MRERAREEAACRDEERAERRSRDELHGRAARAEHRHVGCREGGRGDGDGRPRADGGAAVLLLLAIFGRTRFKYGLRGYRFALLEAGHVIQNVALAGVALDLAVLPLGGFYDAQVDALVGADGVEESVVYGAVLGGAA